jgi:hypothetical protein
MDFKRLSEQAKRLISKRGGTDSLKEDALELRDIARGEGSMSDKAKAAADAIKHPGAKGPDTGKGPTGQQGQAPQEQPTGQEAPPPQDQPAEAQAPSETP